MRRLIAAVTTMALLSGCVSHMLRQGRREPPRREAGLVIAGAVLEGAAASLIAVGISHPSSGNQCEEPCDYVSETGKGLAGLLLAGALVIVLGGSALGDLGVGGLQLATGHYVRETWVHAAVEVTDDEIRLDGAWIATPRALTEALSRLRAQSVLIQSSAGIDCAQLSAVEDAVRAAAVDDVSVTHACVSSR